MNPPMTPLDQTLVDQMKKALSNSAPDIAGPLASQWMELGDTCWVQTCGTSIRLCEPGVSFVLTPEQFQALERFAEQIGWRPQ